MRKRYFTAGFKTIKTVDWVTISRPAGGIVGKLVNLKKEYKVQLCHFQGYPFLPIVDFLNPDNNLRNWARP